MIEIVLSVCLMSVPVQCRDVTLPMMVDNASPYQCMTMGQIEASKWSAEHPGWVLKGWRCAPYRQSAAAPLELLR